MVNLFPGPNLNDSVTGTMQRLEQGDLKPPVLAPHTRRIARCRGPNPVVTDAPVLAPQNRAVVNLFRGPNLIEDVAGTMQRLEQGGLKLPVLAPHTCRIARRRLCSGAPIQS